MILPGLIDCHTHTAFAGSRANEFKEKIESELAIGSETKPVIVDTEEELEDVYAKAQGARHKPQSISDTMFLNDCISLFPPFLFLCSYLFY